MTRLGIISDSHDEQFWVEKYLELANREAYDAVFHLGDGHADIRWLARRLNMPLIGIAGNVDNTAKIDREARVSYEGHLILAVHGYKQEVQFGYHRLAEYAREIGADIALAGHTHRPFADVVDGVQILNPGALKKGCCAELVLDGSRIDALLRTVNGD